MPPFALPGLRCGWSAPQASQGSLLLIEVRSTKSLVKVQGEWGGRTVPIWQEAARERQRKGLLAV